MTRTSWDMALASVLRTQFGLFTARQAHSAGVSRGTLARLVNSGRAARVSRGVYRDVTHAVSQEQRILAACLSLADAAASHRTAAWLHGVTRFRPGGVHIAVPHGRHHESPLAVVHQIVGLTQGDVAPARGVPCLSPEATLLTLASCEHPDAVEDAFVDLACQRKTSIEAVALVVDRLGTSGRTGTTVMRELVERWSGRTLPDSTKEAELARALVRAGLPEPEMQVRIVDERGVEVARVDLAFPQWKIVVEYDSDRFHSSLSARRRDVARTHRMVALGWRVVPATDDDVRDPTAIAGAIRSLARTAA